MREAQPDDPDLRRLDEAISVAGEVMGQPPDFVIPLSFIGRKLGLIGREGILNSSVLATHLVKQPLDFLLFSDFAVIVAYVHILTMMMVAPIVNSMAKIDHGLIAAARDAGASETQIVRDIVIPLSKTGITLGSVLVLTQTMGDFFIVHLLSGGKSAGVVSAIATQLNAFEYPPAAAGSVVLLVVVIALVAAIFRIVDVRKELAG